MGQDYTLNDWLHLLLLFAGMPLVAATGAALALLGRIRRGGFLPATIAGIAGAALASASLYLGLWTLCLESTINPSVFLEIYESGYQRHILIACLLAAFLTSFLFASAWRIRSAPRPRSQVSISLRTALVIQCLSLICVGSWCGLRLLVFHSARPSAMDERTWALRDWKLTNGNTLALDCLSLQPSAVKSAMSRKNLADISNYPKVNSVIIAGCNLSKVDITPLAAAENVSGITFSDCDLNTPNRNDILRLRQLSGVGLQELTAIQPTLTNLARLPKLTEFYAGNVRVQREDFKHLLANSRLEAIYLDKVTILQDGKPIERWPAAMKILSIEHCNFTPDDLKAIGKVKNLVDLQLSDFPMSDEVLEHFEELTALQNASFRNKAITARGFEIILQKMQPPSLHLVGGELPPGVAESLSKMHRLRSLDLTGVILTPQDVETLASSQAIVELRITSPGLDTRLLMKLASIPSLRMLHYPSFRDRRYFDRDFNDERERRSLPRAQTVVGLTIDATGRSYFALD